MTHVLLVAAVEIVLQIAVVTAGAEVEGPAAVAAEVAVAADAEAQDAVGPAAVAAAARDTKAYSWICEMGLD